MTFANPWFLVLFAPLAVAAWRLLRRGRRSGIRFSATMRLPAKTAGWRARLAALTPFILLAGLAALVVAAARPRTPLAHEKKSIDAIAIAMTIDISGSMTATDLTPKGVRPSEATTRLAIVKQLFSRFVERRPDDLIGLVTFATYASAVVPLTADHAMLLHALKGVQVPPENFQDAAGSPIGREPETWTAMGDGIAVALRSLKDSPLKSKIVILLSDGVSNTGAILPKEAAAAASKMGVKIYVIGIGVVPEYIDVEDGFLGQTRRVWTKNIPHKKLVETLGFDEEELKSITKKTGGTYFAVNDRDSLEKALEEIDQLETTKLDADVYDRWDEHFAAFLLGGSILVFLAVSLSMSASRRMA